MTMESPQSNSLSAIAAMTLNDVRLYLSMIDPVLYSTPLSLLSGSSIGQHTRHIIEFFNCLIEQSVNPSQSVINYANRRRDHLIETQPEYALRHLNAICEQLHDLDPSQSCLLDCNEYENEKLFVPSTIGRELIYNIEHTIHHLAIIKIALHTALPKFELPEHFGVAPSTIRHRHEACAQ